MPKKSPVRLVYSSEASLCAKCGWPAKKCRCSTNTDEAVPLNIVAKLRIEKSGRRGKTVTMVEGLPRNPAFVKELAGEIKKACGTGGKAGEKHIEIQGDQRDAIRRLLQARGWAVKG